MGASVGGAYASHRARALPVWGLTLLLASAAAPAGLAAQTPPDTARLFYRGLDYGSDAYFSPLTVFFNKGYEIIQLRNHGRDFWTFPYGTAFRRGVWDAFVRPGPAIERYGGTGLWLRREVLPLTYSRCCANWFVNYTEHLVGGGVIYRMLDEWFEARGVPWPRVWAGLTVMGASLMNETLENPLLQPASGASVADLLVFDLGSVLLFNWDQPARFLSRTLQMSDWSNMASLTFPNGQLQNNGQYSILKVPLGMERTRLFVRGGMGAQFGLSRKVDEERSLTVAAGLDTEVRDVDEATGQEFIEMAFGGGVYFDRNNSLLWSLTVSPAENLLALNVYPGVLPGAGRDLGVWAVYTRHGDLMAGVVHRRALGLGLGLGW